MQRGGAPTVLLSDTLDDPYQASEVLALPTLQAITAQRRTANKVKTETPVMVAIGNPPYRRSVPRSRGGLGCLSIDERLASRP